MRWITPILCFMFTVLQGEGQDKQPVFMGEVSWVRSKTLHGPDSLPVKVTKYRMTKTITKDSKPSIFQRKIEPGTRVIKNGPIVPVTESIQFIGKKFTAPPEKFDAPPLLTRDNAEFNISYTDKQHGYIVKNSTDFAEDDQHNIWISFNDGLVKYDGYHYFLYTTKTGIKGSRPISIVFDKQKRLWFTTEEGVYFIRNDSIYTLKSKSIDFSTISCLRVLIDSSDKIWLSTKKNGAICLDGSLIKIFDSRCGLSSDYVMYTLVDKKGNLWIASHDSGIMMIEPNRIREFFNTPNPIGRNQFFSLYEDEDGMWMGSYYSSLMRIGHSDTLQYSINGKFDERFYDIKKAPGGGLWLCPFGQSVSYYNKKDLIIITAANGLNDRNGQYLFEDSYHNIWVNNIQTGFSRINENSFYINNFENPALSMVRTFIPDDKNGKWVLTSGKNAVYYKGNIATTYTYAKKNFQPFLYNLEGVRNKDGTLWLGNFGEGMVYVDDPYFSTYSFSGFGENQIIRSVKTDGENRVWFCPTFFGLIMYDQKRFWRYTTESGLASNSVTRILEGPKKQMYLETADGLQRIAGNVFETLYINNKRLLVNMNCLLVVDDSTTILGTLEYGLLFIRNNKAYQMKINKDFILNAVKSIIRDVNGKIWISTDKGIESFFLNDLTIKDHKIFNAANGPYLSIIESAFLDSTGIPFWLSREKRIVYNPVFSIENKLPVFSIKEILVDDKSVDLNKKISILPNQMVSINFTYIYWGRENNLEIKYQLISNRGDTSERVVNSRGNIIISQLSPGDYKIVVTGTDNNIVYSNKPILLQINNFWYNTWLFRSVMLGIVLSGVIIYFRQKSIRQKKINELLEKKVAEQTQQLVKEKEELLKSNTVIESQNKEKDILIQEINHRVKNNLQFIGAMLEMQLGKNYSTDTIQALLGTTRRIKAMSLVHEMLYHKTDRSGLSTSQYIHELVNNLKEMVGDLSNPIKFEIEIEDVYLDSRSAISIGMIISELVSNSYKYAFTGVSSPEISIELTKNEDTGYLRLMVSDNGSGIEGDYESRKGLGSRLVDIFSRQLEGDYTIEHTGRFVYILYFKPPEI